MTVALQQETWSNRYQQNKKNTIGSIIGSVKESVLKISQGSFLSHSLKDADESTILHLLLLMQSGDTSNV